MKNFFSAATVAFLLIAGNAHAAILTVNNNSTSPGQYTSLQAAITAAHAGDTLLVSGSNTDYGPNGYNITINKPLTLLGTGFNPIKDNALTSKISNVILQSGSAGTVIVGFVIANNLSTDYNVQVNNITIKRNFIGQINSWGDSWILQENIFGLNNSAITLNGNNILVKNNIFQGSPYTGISNQAANTNFVFSNNVVFGNNFVANNFYNAVVSNNIFYDSSKVSVQYFSTNTANTTFTKNIVYGNPAANPFYTNNNGNTESGNSYNTDPQFNSVKLTAAYGFYMVLDLTSDLSLKATSPGHNYGTDGKDVGLFGVAGSLNPLTGSPAIPQISTMNILNTVVAPGATLNVQIKAKSNN